MSASLSIREIKKKEFEKLGRLMVEVYSNLEGSPTQNEQPGYYEMLANMGGFSGKKNTKVLVAQSAESELVGGVVYFADMAEYGSGGTASTVKNASGIRLLSVSSRFRRTGAGKALTNSCIQLARDKGHGPVVLHTTQAMQIAWQFYQKSVFERSIDRTLANRGFQYLDLGCG